MGIVIEQRPSNFSGGELQSLGNIGTSALDAATAGVAIIDDGDKGIIDDGLKLFGGFDRNSFEYAKAEGKNLSRVIHNEAEYGNPTQVFSKTNDAAYKDVVNKMQDPQFKVSDGLASFAGRQITQTISGQIQKTGTDVLEKGIIIIGGGITQQDFFKLQRLDVAVKHQLDLYQDLSNTTYKAY